MDHGVHDDFMSSVKHNQIDEAEMILKRGRKIDPRWMRHCCQLGASKFVDLLLQHEDGNTITQAKDDLGVSTFCVCVLDQFTKIKSQRTSFEIAVTSTGVSTSNRIETCFTLLSFSASFAWTQFSTGVSPVMHAVTNKDCDLLRLLLPHLTGSQVNEEPLVSAAATGSIKILSLLLTCKLYHSMINSTKCTGEPPLYTAINHGHPVAAALLINYGANPNVATEKTGNTPLHAACFRSNEFGCGSVASLIAYGAKVNAQSVNGYSPLHVAALTENMECCDLLIESGASPSTKSEAGLTPKMTTTCDAIKKRLEIHEKNKNMTENAAKAGALPQSPRQTSPKTQKMVGGPTLRRHSISAFENESFVVKPESPQRKRVLRARSVSNTFIHSRPSFTTKKEH